MGRVSYHHQLYAGRDPQRESAQSQSIVTAVHVVVAWLIAFVCVAALALIS
jgi:hypothetical protein